MRRGTKFLIIGAILPLTMFGSTQPLTAQDEHEQLRLKMVETYTSSSKLFQMLQASLSLREQKGEALNTMDDLLATQGLMLEAKACDPKQYSQVNQELVETWHQLEYASHLSPEQRQILKSLYNLLQEQQVLIRQLAEYHAKRGGGLFSFFSN